MTCASCASRIERVLSRQPGVAAASVNLASRSATVRVTDQIEPQALEEAVRRIGYDMSFRRPEEPPRGLADTYDSEARRQWRRFLVAAVLSAPVMVLAMFGPDAVWNEVVQLLLTTPVVLWAGWPFHKVAGKQLLRGTASMDTLISMGSLVVRILDLDPLHSRHAVFRDRSDDRHADSPGSGARSPGQRAGHRRHPAPRRARGARGASGRRRHRPYGRRLRPRPRRCDGGSARRDDPHRRGHPRGPHVRGRIDAHGRVEASRSRSRRRGDRGDGQPARPHHGTGNQGRFRHGPGADGAPRRRGPGEQGSDPASGRPHLGGLRANGDRDRGGDGRRVALLRLRRDRGDARRGGGADHRLPVRSAWPPRPR